MSTVYTGVPSIARLNTKAVITAASNLTPISITTSAAHGFQTGDSVFVLGIVGNAAANSPQNTVWTIYVTGPSSFTLNGSVGSGAYTSGGFAYDVSPNPAFTVPSDGDAFNAAAFNVAIEAVADRTSLLSQILQPRANFLGGPIGGQLIAQYSGGSSDDTWASWSTGTAVGNGWQTVASGDQLALNAANVRANTGDWFDLFLSAGEVTVTANPAPFAIAYQFSGQSAAFSVAATLSAKRVQTGLTMPLDLRGSVQMIGYGAGLSATITSVAGGATTITGLAGMVAGCVGNSLTLSGCASAGNNGTYPISVFLSATSVVITNASGVAADTNSGAIRWQIDNQTMQFVLQVFGTSGSEPTYNFKGHRAYLVNHYRPNALFPV